MHYTTVLTVVLSALSVLGIPALIMLIRGAVKWTRVEDKLSELVESMKKLVADKDKVHSELLETMRNDRETTDRRLRFIEEAWMKRGTDA